MEIRIGDEVLLKNGEEAEVLEIWRDGKAYEIAVYYENGDVDQRAVKSEEIEKVINHQDLED